MEYYKLEKRLSYINEKIKNIPNNIVIEYTISGDVLRGFDKFGRIIYVKQFYDERELFQFLCGMEHILEVI